MALLALRAGGDGAGRPARAAESAAASAAASASGAGDAGPWPGAALRTVDGDTLELPDGRRLRLDGLDTPERGRPGAARAGEQARALLAGGRWRLHPPDPPRDAYGRLLGGLRDAAGRDLGDLLVAAGAGWIYRPRGDARRALQAAAVDARRGVHAGLDGAGGPFLVTASSFHRPDCGLVHTRGRALPWAAAAAPLLKAGHAPCRRCLRWPPRRTWPTG